MASRETKLTYGLLLGAFLLALIGAYLIVTQVRDLTSARRQLSETRAALGKIKSELATAQADQLYVQDAIYGTTDFLDQSPLGILCAKRPDDRSIQAICRYQSENLALLKLFNSSTRARTAVPRDYRRALQQYREFARFLGPQQPRPHRKAWLARALEGVAYSQLKLGQVGEAKATIAEALSLDPNSAMVGITALKVACSQHDDPAKLREEFLGLRQRLDDRIASTSNDARASPLDRRNAGIERDLLDQDEELYLLCDYAGLKRKRRI